MKLDTLKKFLNSPEAGLYRAITKPVPGNREMLLGFELKNQRSRHYKKKIWLRPPVIIEEAMRAFEAMKKQLPDESTAPPATNP